jgi:hypothetical protein
MHKFVFHATCLAVQKAQFIFVSCDEVTVPLIINHRFLSMCALWKGGNDSPILLTLQQVVEGSHVDNLTKVIVESLLLYGGVVFLDLIG